MHESLRVRLVLWYGLTLLAVVALYGAAVSYQSRRALIAGLDTELRFHAGALAAALRPVDGGHFDLELTPATLDYFRQDLERPYYAIWSQAGDLVDRSDPDLPVARPDQPIARTAGNNRELAVAAPAGAVVLVGRPMTAIGGAQRALVFNLGLAGAAMLAVSLLAGWFLAGRALAPMARISRAARSMAGGDLNARIPIEQTENELEQLASVLNEAFDRQHRAVDQQRRFAADASHELRTPIAVLRAEAEWALDRPRSADEYRQSLTVCQRAAARLQDGVGQLLMLARAESRDPVAASEPIAVQALVDDVVAWLSPIAQERSVNVEVAGDPAEARGDAAQLREALGAIIANAIVYNKRGGRVTISSRANGSHAIVEVADTGIGIPAAAIPLVFDRFYRVDEARTRETGGTGLGLSIAAAIIEAHGGTITCTSQEGVGTVFTVNLQKA